MKILIIGAGPAGLTLAIELARLNISCTIVDKKKEPSTLSRAVGINPRSLEILEKSNITPILLEQGIKINNIHFYHNDENHKLGMVNLNLINHPYNFILSLPQDRTEDIFRQKLTDYGVEVRYGTEFMDIEANEKGASVTLKKDEKEFKEEFDLVVGADGSNSLVRKKMNIEFKGFDLEKIWSIADFDSADFPFDENRASAFLHDNGDIGFVIKIANNRYRIVAAGENAFANIGGKYKIDLIHRQGTFHIGLKQAETYNKKCVYLVGDAAHIHSPIGGRGMNLGIEDAYILAKFIKENNLSSYAKNRHIAGKKCIGMNAKMIKILSSNNALIIFFRNLLIKYAAKGSFPLLHKKFVNNIAGLN